LKWFIEAVTADRGEGKRKRTKSAARKEFYSRWAWGIGRALVKTDEQMAQVHARVAEKVADCVGQQPDCVTGEPTKPGENTDTDSGNATVLVREYRDSIRYVDETGKWIAWDGVCWHPESGSSAVEYAARALADKLEVPSLPEPMSVINPDGADDEEMRRAKWEYGAALDHKMRSLSRHGILGAVKVAESDPDFRISVTALDTNAYELSTPTGTVNLKTGELGGHDRNAWHTRLTGVAFDPDAPHPKWDRFLKTTFEGDVEKITFMQRLAGYSCIGSPILSSRHLADVATVWGPSI
jgi:phage/plasmid-associated DNA primase